MTLWNAILLAAIGCVLLKLLGYLVPASWMEGPRASRTADLLTVALLAARPAPRRTGSSPGPAVGRAGDAPRAGGVAAPSPLIRPR